MRKMNYLGPYYENEALCKRVEPQLQLLKDVLPVIVNEAPKKRVCGSTVKTSDLINRSKKKRPVKKSN